MVIDTSAVLAWLKHEPERERIVAALEAHAVCRISAVSLLEAHIVVRAREHHTMPSKLQRFLEEIGAIVMPFDEQQAHLANEASRRYGKGQGHPAQLNMGDCAVYALAKFLDEPLLFVGNSLAQAVLDSMIDIGEYFFLAIGPNQGLTAFRSEIGAETLAGITDNLARIKRSTTSDAQYQQALSQFQKRLLPPGQLLSWVCRDNVGYLDIASDPLEMTPAASNCGETISAGDNTYRVSQRRALAELLDGKVNELDRAGITDDFMLLSHMAPDMPLFKRLMDLSDGDDMNDLCNVYPGLYRFAKLLERIATGIQSGDIEVPH